MKMNIVIILLFVLKLTVSIDLTTKSDDVSADVFTTSNHIQYEIIKVRLGSAVKLECNYYYNYEENSNENAIENSGNGNDNKNVYKMLWLRENKGVIAMNNEVKYNREKYSIESTSTNSLNLVINNVQVDDNGKYICQHFDFSNLKQFLLVILVPPHAPQISFKINNQSAYQLIENFQMINLYENDLVQLNCFTKYSGNPSSVYKWYRNDIEISSQFLAPIAAVNNILYIRNVENSQHLDKYTCAIINEALDEPLKASIQLNVYFKPYVSIFFNSSQNFIDKNNTQYIISYKTVENSSEIILCSVKANPKPIKVEWYKDNIFMENITDYTYEISRININHRGLYSCRVYNSLGVGHYEVELNVQYKPILNIESIYEIHEGYNANIICDIDSNPPYSYVTWYFNSDKLITPFSDVSAELQTKLITTQRVLSTNDFSFTDFSYVQFTNQSVLRINNVRNSYNDAIIKCEASNEIYMHDVGYNVKFTSEITTRLSILYKPIIESSINKIAVELNNVANLECAIRSNPFSNFYWVFNETIFANAYDFYEDLNIKINNEIINNYNKSQLSTLTIKSVQHKQFGWYRCYANNSVGFSVHEIYLMLATIPDVPINLNVLNKTYSSALLYWKPEFDGGSEQTFIILVNNEREIETKSHVYQVKDLEDSTEYEFKIKSVNKYGSSAWSNPINITTYAYLYSHKDIKVQIYEVDKENDDLRILFNNDELHNKTTTSYSPSKLKYVIRFVLKASMVEYYNISKNQTYFIIPYSIYLNKTDQINASICLEFKPTICSQSTVIDLLRFYKKDANFIDSSNQLTNLFPSEIFNIVSKRFNLLVVIAGSILTVLLLMVFGGYLIYRIAFNKTDEVSEKNNKTKNGLDLINTSPIIAFSENDGMNDFQYPNDNLDPYSLSSTNNINTFNASKIVPIPEVNEEIFKDDETSNKIESKENDDQANNTISENSSDKTVNFNALEDNPIYNHLSPNSKNNSSSKSKKLKNKHYLK